MNSETVYIRRTRDLDLIAKLNNRAEFFPEDPIKPDDNSTWFLARLNGEIVGWAGCDLHADGTAKISRTGVFKAFQGRGIKQRLVKTMERYVKRQGCKTMTSYCAYWNLASANSLIKSGYKLRKPSYVKHDGQWLCWRKEL